MDVSFRHSISLTSPFFPLCLLQESRHDKEKSDKKEKRDSSGGKEEKKQYPFTFRLAPEANLWALSTLYTVHILIFRFSYFYGHMAKASGILSLYSRCQSSVLYQHKVIDFTTFHNTHRNIQKTKYLGDRAFSILSTISQYINLCRTKCIKCKVNQYLRGYSSSVLLHIVKSWSDIPQRKSYFTQRNPPLPLLY